ncbi:MAG: DUF126 domain-containing protein [Nitrososphaerota archaeon]|nr:DUF126 domain-containing protein [Nitrososphaerota archaeon]MDG6923568.1 DUF126 domain-containing protein [Nitrososphaerota archaeon]
MKQLKLRCIVEGSVRGDVLFSSQPIAFLQGVDPENGFVSDKKHEIYGKHFSGKVLVFPNSVGSSVGAYVIYRLKRNGIAPRAMVNQNADIITASGCALSGIPLYDVVEGNISELKDAKRVTFKKNQSILHYH